MLKFIAKRLLLIVPIVLGVTLMIFLLTRVLPADPVYSILGPFASEEDVEAKRIALGLDKPLIVQYGRFLQNLVKGDLGFSYRTQQPVAKDLLARFPVTFELTTLSLMTAVLIGIPAGVWAAVKKGTLIDHIVRVLSVGGVSIPVFWSGIVLVYVFYFLLKVAPAPMGRLDQSLLPPTNVTGMYIFDSLITGNWETLRSSISHLTLPIITLAFAMVGPIMRMTRNSMLEAINSRHVQASLALGIPYKEVIFSDALRNALLPVITTVGLQYGWSLGGEVLVESVFSIPGMGYYAMNSILNMDYAPVQAFVMVTAVIYVVINLVMDVIYTIVDPRIKY